MSDIKIFSNDECNFFDDLVTYLATLTSLGITLHGYNHGYTRVYEPNENIVLYGNPEVVNLELCFFPSRLMKKLASNDWPDKLKFGIQNRPVKTTFDPGHKLATATIHSRVDGVLGFQIQGGFIRYFESFRGVIENIYGVDVWAWPSVWNFARVVRNSFAHKGFIDFKKETDRSVTWRSLNYSFSDNGTNILHNNIGIVEIIFLMDEMDQVIKSNT